MKITYRFLILSLLILSACKVDKQFALNKITPVILEENGTEIYQYWEFPNDEQLWSPGLNDDVIDLKQYRDSIKEILGKERYEKAILRQETITSSVQNDSYSENGDRKNFELIHDGTLGNVRKINVLESELLNYQAGRYPLFSHPTEFHAFFLKHDSLDMIRVYFCSSDQPWPPKPKPLRRDIDKRIQEGWRLAFHLHNHFEDEETDYVGVMAPSIADAHYFQMLYENYKVEKTLITNGFNTVEMGPEDFDHFAIE